MNQELSPHKYESMNDHSIETFHKYANLLELEHMKYVQDASNLE